MLFTQVAAVALVLSAFVFASADSGSIDEDVRLGLELGTRWLLSQRKDNWGWRPRGNAEGLIAAQLASPQWCCKSMNSQLTVNRIHIELLAILLRKRDLDVKEWFGGKLGQYINALALIGHNPRDFYGVDLVEILEAHMDAYPRYFFNQGFTFSWTVIALHNARVPIHQRHIDRLIETQKEDFTKRSLDVQTMIVQALSVLNQTEEVKQAMKIGVTEITKARNADGSYGNEFTTALSFQALLAAKVSLTTKQKTQTLRYLLSKQGKDGSFRNLLAGFQVLPGLAQKPYTAIREERYQL